MPNRFDHVRLRCGVVLRVGEDSCEVWSERRAASVRFAPQFPAPRTTRVSPGHLVAIASSHTGDEVVVWRWYDAVVVEQGDDASVRVWEPGHGEVVARTRSLDLRLEPGSRVSASAGLPGAEWWVAGVVGPRPEETDVELAEVRALYAENELWPVAFGSAQ